MPDGWDYDPVRDTYRPSSRSKSSQSQNENNSLVPEGGEEDGEAGTGYEGGNAVTNAKDEDAATDEDRESSGSEETRRASNRSSPAREGKDASGDTAKDKAGDDSATEDDTEDDATDDDEDEDDDEDSDGHTVLKDDYDFDIREHGIAHLSNPDFPFAKAMEAYIVIGIDPYGNIKRPREQYWAWRNMYRLLNTAVVLYHGRGYLGLERQLIEWRDLLRIEIDDDFERRLGPLDNGVLRFAGDASMDADDLSYRFPVADPTVGFWRMTISNIGLPPGADLDPTANHAGAVVSEAGSYAVTEAHRRRPAPPGQRVCPWAEDGSDPCGPRCRALARRG